MKKIVTLLSLVTFAFLVGCVTTEPTKEDLKNQLIAEQVKLELLRELRPVGSPIAYPYPAAAPIYGAPLQGQCGCPTYPVVQSQCSPCASGQTFYEKQ